MMKNGRQYDIFPRTFGARVLLTVGFLVGGLVFAAYWAFFVLSSVGALSFGLLDEMEVTYANETDGPVYVYLEERLHTVVPANSEVMIDYRKIEWWFNRDVLVTTENGQVLFSQPLDYDDLKEKDFRITVKLDQLNACHPRHYPACLEVHEALTAGAVAHCGQSDICFVPLGGVSSDLVRSFAEYYEDEYGLSVDWTGSIAIPRESVNSNRNQVDAIDLAKLIEARGEAQGGSAMVVGLTNVDMYIGSSEWRYAFGFGGPPSVISTARMDPAFWGAEPDEGLTASRARKLVTKYIGGIHYGLSPSDDPSSPMYGKILSAEDLDRMTEPLPVMDH